MTKRILSLFLSICLISGLFSIPVHAEDTITGYINGYTSWTLNPNNGHLDIFVEEGDSLEAGISYETTIRDMIKTITVTGNIKVIASEALKWLKNVESISLPDTVTEIGDYAFLDCNSLKEINLPENLKTIGSSAFSNCSKLEAIVFPSGMEKIDTYAFSGCSSLKSIYLPQSLSTVNDDAFSYCTSLASIQVSSKNLFFHAENNILYDKAKTTIVRYAPGKADKSFTTPSSVKTIGATAFDSCQNLQNVIIGDNVTMINSSAFDSCSSLTDISLGDSLLYIGPFAFARCSSLKSVTIPDNITTISKFTFTDCKALTTVQKGENLIRLEDSAFDNCSSLSSFDFSNITSIGSYAFNHTNLSSAEFDDCLVSIGDYAFHWCKNLSNVTFPDGLSHIGEYAFYACPLKEVALGNNIATITEGAFAGCEIEKFTIGSALVKIEDYAFYGCEFTEINLGPNIKTIGNEAFLSCWDLVTISLGKKLISVGTDAFLNTDLLYVNYEGSESDWSKVVINSGNWALKNAKFTYNYLPLGFVDYKPPFSSDPDEPIKVNFSSGKGKTDIYYSDNFFTETSYKYNHNLAKASLRLAVSAFAKGNLKEGKLENHYANAKDLLSNLEFENITYNDWYTTLPEKHSIGVISGKKHVKYPDGDYTLIAVAVRGGNYVNEWGGNFTVGTENLHEGFVLARDQVIEHIQKYIYNQKIYGKVKLWITGYSRAAATTNLTAAILDENPHMISEQISLSPKDIFAYCFETPMGVVNPDNESGLYNNIFSIVNPHDFVPMVAMRKWDFDRYGITKYLPTKYTHGYKYNEFLSKVATTYNTLKGDEYIIDSASYPGYPSGQNGFLEKLINTVATTVGSKENYVALYQEVFEWIGEELLGKGDAQNLLNTFKEKLLEKKVLLAVEGGAVVLNPVLPWDTAGAGTGALYLTLRSVIIETFDALGVSVSPQVINTLLEIALKIGVKDIITLTSNGAALKQGHEPTLCMAWLDIIDDSDFGTGNTRILKLTCPLPTKICDLNGNTVAQYNTLNRSGTTETLYSYTDDDGSIIVYLPENQQYTVEISATQDAEVSYSVQEVNGSTGNANITTYKTTIKSNDILTGTIENLEEASGEYPLLLNQQQLTPASRLEDAQPISVNITAIGNGNVTSSLNCYPGETVTVTATPIEGETFIGWYNEYNELVSADTTYTFTPSDTTMLTGEFSENTCSVLFIDGNNTIETKRILKGNKVTFPSAPEKDWYTFENYYKYPDFSDLADPSEPIYENTIIYAKYKSDFSYYINYDNEISVEGYNGTKTDVSIPEEIDGYTVTEVYFSESFNNTIESITFPSSVISIDYMPFEGYTSLKSFFVDENNEYYYAQDGVLISKSMNSIICYPNGKTELSYTIPAQVTSIESISNTHLKELIMHENMYDISWYPLENSGIETILYAGTEESFYNVLNTWEEDGVLNNATVYFNYNNTPVSATLDCTSENGILEATISYNYVFTDCTAYIGIYTSDGKLLKFTKAGEVTKNQNTPTQISFTCSKNITNGYAKILFLTALSTLKPAGMWTASDIYEF